MRARLWSGAADALQELVPALLCLALPAGIVLGIALYAASPATPETDSPQKPDAGFRFEQIDDRTERLIHDGAGHKPGQYGFVRTLVWGPRPDLIAVEPDGSVLTCCDRPHPILDDHDEIELHRLGDAEPLARWDAAETRVEEINDLTVAEDGSVWVAGDGVARWDGDDWVRPYWKRESHLVVVGPDGIAWADVVGGRLRIVRIRNDKAKVMSPGNGLPRAVRDWSSNVSGIAVTSDDDVWVGVDGKGREAGGLLRFDGTRWRIARPLGRGATIQVEGLTSGPDRTLWAYITRTDRPTGEGRRAESYLVHREDGGWTVFRERDGVPINASTAGEPVLMRGGPDGTLWMTPFVHAGCRRLVSFRDGRFTSHFGAGACVHDLELDIDGRAWVSIEWLPWLGAERWTTGLYRVEPPT